MAQQEDQVRKAELLKQRALEAIDQYADNLHELNRKIYEHPELAYEEHYAHDLLSAFFEEHGFDVTRHYTGVQTAFRAAGRAEVTGLKVGLICEYDALPEIGHACGHNLIAEAGAAAGLGLNAALQSINEKLGQVVILGTPAEESGGGKIKLIENGGFESLDFCMMTHPDSCDVSYFPSLACCDVEVIYKGQAAHAAAFPWEGLNALDAAVMAYNNISVLRQQMKPAWRVHGIIDEGGVKPNIIPERTKLTYRLRAEKRNELVSLVAKVKACFEAAALATGCSVEFSEVPGSFYADVITNPTLATFYELNAGKLGMQFPSLDEQKKMPGSSTDMGNVSHVVPSLHSMYSITDTAVCHSRGFAAAAGTREAHEKTLIAAKALAMTAIDVLCNPALMKKISEEFKRSVA